MLKTTIAGSLPKPGWLAETEKLWPAWELEGEDLEQAKRDATLIWIKEQETAGIDIIGGGEQFRIHFVHGFLEHINGIDWEKKTKMGIRDNRYVVDVPTVTSKVSRKYKIHSDEVAYTRANTARQMKFTLPGPMTICDTIADAHYGSRPEMAMAFAELLNEEAKELVALGANVIQFDEPAFNAFPKETVEWGLDTLNRACEGIAATTAVHICYGYGIKENIDWKKTLGSEWRQYEMFFPELNKAKVQQVSLECANSRVPIDLIGLLKDKDVLVGSIDVASDKVETPEEVAATIRKAMEFVDPERLYPCTNCGMAPLARNVAVGKLKALGAGAELVRQSL